MFSCCNFWLMFIWTGMRKNNKFWKWTPSREFNFRFTFYVSFSSICKHSSCIQAWKGLALPWVEAFLLKGHSQKDSNKGVGTTLHDKEGSQLIHLHFAHCTESETELSTISSFCVFSPLGLWSHFVRLFQVVEVSAQFQKSFSAFLLLSCGDVSLSTVAFNYQQPSFGDWRWFVMLWCGHWQLDFLLKFTFYLFKN